MLRDKRDSIIAANGEQSDKTTSETSSSDDSSSSSDEHGASNVQKPEIETAEATIDDLKKHGEEGNEAQSKFEVKLPENLPPNLSALIRKILETAKQPISKSNFFTAENLQTLLR